jgi:hypothetical protein
MINLEMLGTAILAIGLSLLLMTAYVSLKFSSYTPPVNEYTLKHKNTVQEDGNKVSTLW